NLYCLALLTVTLMFAGATYAQPGMMFGWFGLDSPRPGWSGPVDKDKAESIMDEYLEARGDSNLKPGQIAEQDLFFEGEVLNQDDEVVNRVRIDKRTGRIYGRTGSEYGPAASGDWNYCPYCGQGFQGGDDYGWGRRHRGAGPGMMVRGYDRGYDRGYGPGMMGRGRGPGMMGRGYDAQPGWNRSAGEAVDVDTAKEIVRESLSRQNLNLKIGKVTEEDRFYKIEIVTKKSEDQVGVMAVEKDSGYMRPVY
ncbi:MAG: hypothetical protein R6U29_11650, partial [Desulfosudaceae bacterium]